MQAAPSPLAKGSLPLPASPADSGFLPRREFASSKRPTLSYSLLTLTGTSSIRLSGFPPEIVSEFKKFFDDRALLRLFRENTEDEIAEYALAAKYWSNPKAPETEKLVVAMFVTLNSLGYSFVSTIDFGRDQGDKLTIAFSKPSQQSSTAVPLVHQLVFGISFTSQTSLRCIFPPLESTPGILQALRSAWPRGIDSESKVGEGCYEFKLKGYGLFANETFLSDSLKQTLSLLKQLDRHNFTLLSNLSITNTRHRSKDLWIFGTYDTASLTPQQLIASITPSAIFSPSSFKHPDPHNPVSKQPSSDTEEFKHTRNASSPPAAMGTMGGAHGRSVSVDQGNAPHPTHQRNATAPTNIGTLSPSPSRTGHRQQSAVLKKSSSARAAAIPAPMTSATNIADQTPPSTAGSKNYPPKAPTPPGVSSSKQPGFSSSLNRPPPPPQVLYATSGDVLYQTPPNSPPSAYGQMPLYSTNPGMPYMPPPVTHMVPASNPSTPVRMNRPGSLDLPSSSQRLAVDALEDEGPTPPLLSSSAFRDTAITDRDTMTLTVRDSSFSSQSDVPGLWTSGAAVLMSSLGGVAEEQEETYNPDDLTDPPASPTVPGGWVEEPPLSATSTSSKPATFRSPTSLSGNFRSSKEKERSFDAKVDGAQVINNHPYGAGMNGLERRKSQEAIVQTIPGSTTALPATASPIDQSQRQKPQRQPKDKDGWVIVNVSGDGHSQGRDRVNRFTDASGANNQPRPPARTPGKDSSTGASASEGESATAANHVMASKTSLNSKNDGTSSPPKTRSGFKKLFGRQSKDKSDKYPAKHGTVKEEDETSRSHHLPPEQSVGA